MITVDILEPDADTVVAAVEMETLVDGSIDDPVRGEGNGQLVVGLESANRAQLLVEGRVLRWNGVGDVPFHTLIENNGQVSKAETTSQVPRQITVSGRGIIAQWAAVRVSQWPGMRHREVRYYTRHFNYAPPGKSADIDGTAYEHGLVLDFDAYGQPNNPAQPPPQAWRDPTAQRIWSAAYSGDQEQGTSLFKVTITVDADKVFRQHLTADDRALPWIGGVPVGRLPDFPTVVWHDTYPTTTLLVESAGTYDIVVRCENEFSVPGLSIAWLGQAGWLLDSPSTPLTAGQLIVHSDDSWNALDCTDTPTPGWTVPEILTVLLAEFQDDGGLTGWTIIDMGPTVSVEWDQLLETNFETKKTTGLDVINQFANGQAEFDVIVEGGVKKLRCFPPGTMGTYHTSPADPPELTAVDITDLSFGWVQ